MRVSPRLPSVLTLAKSASSTDRPEESAANTLEPSRCSTLPMARKRLCGCHARPCYWSSCARLHVGSDEWITYGAATPCVVTALRLLAYSAFWQRPGPDFEPPRYWPRAVALSLVHCGSGSGALLEPHTVECLGRWDVPDDAADEAVTFPLLQPVLVLGGVLRLELHGKRQRQPGALLGVAAGADDFYTCINFCHVEGFPLLGFSASPAGGQASHYRLRGPQAWCVRLCARLIPLCRPDMSAHWFSPRPQCLAWLRRGDTVRLPRLWRDALLRRAACRGTRGGAPRHLQAPLRSRGRGAWRRRVVRACSGGCRA